MCTVWREPEPYWLSRPLWASSCWSTWEKGFTWKNNKRQWKGMTLSAVSATAPAVLGQEEQRTVCCVCCITSVKGQCLHVNLLNKTFLIVTEVDNDYDSIIAVCCWAASWTMWSQTKIEYEQKENQVLIESNTKCRSSLCDFLAFAPSPRLNYTAANSRGTFYTSIYLVYI